MERLRRQGTQESLGAIVRERRLELGLSQEELAAQASGPGDEVRQSDISRLERGRVGLPRRDRFERLAAALGLPVGELLARSGWTGAEAAFGGEIPPVPAAASVLLVDDEPVEAEALAALLAGEGHAVRVVADAPAALAEAGRNPPVLVVADARLLGEDAVSLAVGLRRLSRPIPLLLVGTPPPGISLEGVPTLGRPLRAADLLAAVASLVGRGG